MQSLFSLCFTKPEIPRPGNVDSLGLTAAAVGNALISPVGLRQLGVEQDSAVDVRRKCPDLYGGLGPDGEGLR